MAGTLDFTNAVGVADADTFVPEIWSLEVLASYKANLVMAALVTLLNHKGKKGDTIRIPIPTRGSASAKAEANTVTLQAFTDTDITVVINQHWEYSRVIEDILEIQGLASLRRFFTEDAGYALAKNKDTKLHQLAATWGGGTAYSAAVIGSDGSTAWNPSASGNAGNAAALADAGVRKLIQTFDDLDVPGRDRQFVIPPVEKKNLLGVARFSEQQYVGEAGAGNSIRNGLVGDIYGNKIYVSSRCETVADTGTATDQRAVLYFQKDALVLAEQMAPRVQQQYKLEALGTLMVSDELFGVKTVRGGASGDNGAGCKAVIVPA